MIIDKNPTFIGPTTGIQGLFHGAWYYYLLIIPFLLFGGEPIGYYYFNFFLQLASYLALLYFSYKYFGLLTTFIFSLLIATSPYFIFTSIFVGNNIFVMPTLLIFILINYFLLNRFSKKLNTLTFLSGLFLGLIAEFELAFGLFIIPSYFLIILMINDFRTIYLSSRNLLYFLVGLAIPFIPRFFFEIKNNFTQTKILFSNLTQGSAQNVNSYAGAIQDRIILFYDYYKSIFFNDYLLLFFTIILLVLLVTALNNKIKKYDSALIFLIPLLSFLFLFAALYKNNFFWGNYYEGIQYLIIFILAALLTIQFKTESILFSTCKLFFALAILVSSTSMFIKEFKSKPTNSGNLKSQIEIVNHIQKSEKNNNQYCVKVYTPPVIPHTYNYLFLHKKLSEKIETPRSDWVNRACWYIVEADQNNERRDEWLDKNIPRVAKMTQKKLFNDVEVRHYEIE